MKQSNTSNEPVWNLDTTLNHEPDQPEQAEYLQISYRGGIIKPKPYERILLQAYNHSEINWEQVSEQRAKAEKELTAAEWLLYRNADKTFKVWHRINPYITDQFNYLNTYTDLIRNVIGNIPKQNENYPKIIDDNAKDNFKHLISKLLALHTMEQSLFVTNKIRDFMKPPRVEHHLFFIIASMIEYCKIMEIDFKPEQSSFQGTVDIIGFDKYTYDEIKKTVLFYIDQIEL